MFLQHAEKKEDAPIFAHPPICKYIKFQKSH